MFTAYFWSGLRTVVHSFVPISPTPCYTLACCTHVLCASLLTCSSTTKFVFLPLFVHRCSVQFVVPLTPLHTVHFVDIILHICSRNTYGLPHSLLLWLSFVCLLPCPIPTQCSINFPDQHQQPPPPIRIRLTSSTHSLTQRILERPVNPHIKSPDRIRLRANKPNRRIGDRVAKTNGP